MQRRTLRLLFSTQLVGGIGVGIGVAVGALLAADLASVRVSGLAQSVAVVGAALLTLPVTRIIRQYGRRPGLAAAYLAATCGGLAVVAAAVTRWVPLLFVGLFLFGGGTTANLQARYTAVDLAPPPRRARDLSLVIWAATLGAVAGPNLASLAGSALAWSVVPALAGPFVFSGLLFGLAAVVLLGMLRPDPLLVARRLTHDPGTADPGAADPGADPGADSDADSDADSGAAVGSGDRTGMRAALAAVAARPDARLGVAAGTVGYLVMVAVMVMTPVHIQSAGHHHTHTLRIVGLVLSVHIAGMFAFAPVLGWLADRYGRRPIILGGVGLLLAACALAGTAGHDAVRLSTGLFLLGLGWSALLVTGSTLLAEAVPEPVRPSVQGLADLVMLLSGALSGALSGLVVAWSGYPTLNLLAAIATVPLIALTLRPVAPARS